MNIRARILEQVANSQSFDASQLRNFRSYDISQLPILKHFAAKIKTQSCENLVALQRWLSTLATAPGVTCFTRFSDAVRRLQKGVQKKKKKKNRNRTGAITKENYGIC